MTKAIAIHFYTGERAPCKARITLDNYTRDISKVTCKNCLAWLERRKPKTMEEQPMAKERKRPTKKNTETPATPETEIPTTDQAGDELDRIALRQLQKAAANMNEALGFDPPIPVESEDMDVLQEAIKKAATEILVEDNPAGENVKKSLAENPDFPHLTEETWAFLMEAGMLTHLAPTPEKKKTITKKAAPKKESERYTRFNSMAAAMKQTGGKEISISDFVSKSDNLYSTKTGKTPNPKEAANMAKSAILLLRSFGVLIVNGDFLSFSPGAYDLLK